jgi:DNA replication protein DnaC
LKNLKKFDLIILDELGYVPLGERGAELFFQVIADCYEKKSLIVATNIEFSNWVGVFMDKKITSAIIDRIVHHGHLIMFSGSNWRVKKRKILIRWLKRSLKKMRLKISLMHKIL